MKIDVEAIMESSFLQSCTAETSPTNRRPTMPNSTLIEELDRIVNHVFDKAAPRIPTD